MIAKSWGRVGGGNNHGRLCVHINVGEVVGQGEGQGKCGCTCDGEGEWFARSREVVNGRVDGGVY